jgi:nucleoside-diphosphate-sugar epimerase
VVFEALQGTYDVFGVDIRAGRKKDRHLLADISSLPELDQVFSVAQPAYVVHLAASDSTAGWEDILRTNIIGTHNVYECVKKYRTGRVVFASSNHVTGAYEGFPRSLHEQPSVRAISVRDPVRPDGDYGVSKIFGEAVARQYQELWGISTICLRIGSVTKKDDPRRDPRMMKTWLSHRDLVQLIERSLGCEVGFGVYYGISANDGAFWDISDARTDLDYEPRDNAARR